MYKAKILIVDDEMSNLMALRKVLEQENYKVAIAQSADHGLQYFVSEGADIIFTDMRMPGKSGLDLLRAVRKKSTTVPVVILTAFGTIDNAVSAMKLGAVDFLAKPLTRKSILKAVENCYQQVQAKRNPPRQEEILLGNCQEIINLKRTIRMVAPTQASVVIEGESGTGKELVAKILHQESSMKKPMVSINCAAIPENLLESELFGYERGAFTGANQSKPGLFELAHNSTLFFDEIGEMPLKLQTKLLRVLEDGAFFRLGSVEPCQTKVRIVAATNANIQALIAQNAFRKDLWYRLNVICLTIPPLRDRGNDVLFLADHFLKRTAKKYKRTDIHFSVDAIKVIKSYHWPGNIRELSNAVERSVVMTSGNSIEVPVLRILQSTNSSYLNEPLTIPMGTSLKSIESTVIHKTLEAMDGDKNRTAKALGVNLRTIYRKLQENPPQADN